MTLRLNLFKAFDETSINDIWKAAFRSLGGDPEKSSLATIPSIDTEGSTVSFPGTAVELPQNVPDVDGNVITEALIINNESQATRTLSISFDNGATFITIVGGSAITKEPKGNIKHLVIQRGGIADVENEVLLNRKSN